MANKITERTETVIVENEDGIEVSRTTKQTTNKTAPNSEPGFVKIYSRAWIDSNRIPPAARNLFIEIAMRMSYANPNDYEGGQIVYLISPVTEEIMEKLQIKKSRYHALIKILCDCHAIRRIKRGIYQISPFYAGKGEWKYNPRFQRGGVEDLCEKFKAESSDMDINIKVIWGDDGENNDFNTSFRDALGVSADVGAVLKEESLKLKPEIDEKESEIMSKKTIPDLLKSTQQNNSSENMK